MNLNKHKILKFYLEKRRVLHKEKESDFLYSSVRTVAGKVFYIEGKGTLNTWFSFTLNLSIELVWDIFAFTRGVKPRNM